MRGALLLLLFVQAAAPSQLISRGGSRERAVALTFDAGADRGYGARILKTLERFRIRATFGMTGRWAEQNPDLVRRMARDGDSFINHTYDHRSFTGFSSRAAPLNEAQRVWEMWKTEQIVRRLTRRTTRPYFRPPYGDYDGATLEQAGRLGYRYTIMWTVDSLGWEGLSAPTILERCSKLLAPGDIYLMHVGIRSQDALALPAFVRELLGKRYRILTIPQLLARGH
jgi:peptidoglycan/xylan/chitin deacetylase (PgdA/CDA1 family)